MSKFDDFGCAVLISVDYAHNIEAEAKAFFNHLYSTLLSMGFSFDNRVFYKVAPQFQIESDLKLAVCRVKEQTNSNPKDFLRSIHLIPLSKFHDVTAAVTAAAAI